MKSFFANIAMMAVVVFGGGVSMAPARAAPPTVTPSSGYDARLQEQRPAPMVYEPAVRDRKPVARRRIKPVHDGNAH
jgi:hypothetical protein